MDIAAQQPVAAFHYLFDGWMSHISRAKLACNTFFLTVSKDFAVRENSDHFPIECKRYFMGDDVAFMIAVNLTNFRNCNNL